MPWTMTPFAGEVSVTVGGVVVNEKISRMAFVLYILFISMASAHHLLVDPGFSSAWKIVNTSYFMYMAVLASMVGLQLPHILDRLTGGSPATASTGP